MKKLFTAITIGMFACSSIETSPIISSQSYNFVAIGSELTAGFTNSGLYKNGQLNSFPNLVAEQFSKTYKISFDQPLLEGAGTGYQNGLSQIAPTAVRAENPIRFKKHLGKNSNWGVPQIRMVDILNKSISNVSMPSFNPFYERLLQTGEETETPLNVMLKNKPTHFVLEIGSNDVYKYVLSGGTEGRSSIETFGSSAQTLFETLKTTGAAGVIVLIPQLENIDPFITASDLKSLKGTSSLYYNKAGKTEVNERDFLLPRALNNKNATLSDADVLDATEAALAKETITEFNKVLTQLATRNGYAILDINALYAKAPKTKVNKSSVTLAKGSFFGSDGIYPSSQGNAIIANEVISLLNSQFALGVTNIDLNNFKEKE